MGGRRALIICFSAAGRAFVLSCAMNVFACTVCVCEFFIIVIHIFFLVLEVFIVRTLGAHNDSLLLFTSMSTDATLFVILKL